MLRGRVDLLERSMASDILSNHGTPMPEGKERKSIFAVFVLFRANFLALKNKSRLFVLRRRQFRKYLLTVAFEKKRFVGMSHFEGDKV